jgi:hypothetical protein
MSSSRFSLTPDIHQTIVAYVRGGGFPYVAAEAAGVPRRVFKRWLRRGKGSQALPEYRSLADAVREAAAQARLGAEVAVRDSKPLDWLRYGPGRESAAGPGWTSAVRPRPPSRSEVTLLDPALQAIITAVLDALADQPDIRAGVSRRLLELKGAARRGK